MPTTTSPGDERHRADSARTPRPWDRARRDERRAGNSSFTQARHMLRWTAIASIASTLPNILGQPLELTVWGVGALAVAVGSWLIPRTSRYRIAALDLVDAFALAVLAATVSLTWEPLLVMAASLWYRSFGAPARRTWIYTLLYVGALTLTHALTDGALGWDQVSPTLSVVPFWLIASIASASVGRLVREHDQVAAIRKIEADFGPSLVGEKRRACVRARAREQWDALCTLFPGLIVAEGEFRHGRWQPPHGAVSDGRDWHVVPRPSHSKDNHVVVGVPADMSARLREACVGALAAIEMAVQHFHDHLLLAERALTDELTGLANRAGFFAALEPVEGHTRDLSVLFFDLDKFKPINDMYGHGVGDEVLSTAANRLTRACTGALVCARLGGDEFAAVFPHADDAELAAVGAAVTDAFDLPVHTSQGVVSVGVSWGRASVHDGDVSRLLAAADADMYRAKPSRAHSPRPQSSQGQSSHGQSPRGGSPTVPHFRA